MHRPVATNDPAVVESEMQAAYLAMFPDGDRQFVPQAFSWAKDCFAGRYRDYQAVDTRYHDFEHTLQGTLCLARLLQGRHRANAQPALTERMMQLCVVGILLHDAGYLKKRDDTEGTGAKYTIVHVDRSVELAAQLLAEKGFTPAEIAAVRNMIYCTGINASPGAIHFESELEKIGGFALATADLLGQMAADDYVDKLPLLYAEFAEAANFSGDKTHFVGSFSSAEDLIHKTPVFWEAFVQTKLEYDFAGLYRFLNDPYPAGPNSYIKRITANMARLKKGEGVKGEAKSKTQEVKRKAAKPRSKGVKTLKR